MRNFLFLFILLPLIAFGQGSTTTPYDTAGWDEPHSFTTHYGLPVYRLLSNPGGWINRSQRDTDSLLYELVVYTDTTEMFIEDDTLKINHAYIEAYINEDAPYTQVVAGTEDYMAVKELVVGLHINNTLLTDSTIGILSKGTYRAHFHFDIDASAAMTILAHMFVNNIEKPNIGSYARIGVNGVENMSVSGLLELSIGDVVKVKVKSTSGTGNLIFQHGNVILQRIGRLQ